MKKKETTNKKDQAVPSTSKGKPSKNDPKQKNTNDKSKSRSKSPPSPKVIAPKEPSPEDIEKEKKRLLFEEEQKRKESEELAKQASLENKLKEINDVISFEIDQREKLITIKRQEITKKQTTIYQMSETNKRLQSELEYLQVEVQNKLDKYEFKQRNDLFQEEREKREGPLEQLIKVKEKELNNAMMKVEKNRKEREEFERVLREKIDIVQINSLNDQLKIHVEKVAVLEKSLAYLNKIKEEHDECIKHAESEKKEIEELKKTISNIKSEDKEKKDKEKQDKTKKDKERYDKTYHALKERDNGRTSKDYSNDISNSNPPNIKAVKEKELKERIDSFWEEKEMLYEDMYNTNNPNISLSPNPNPNITTNPNQSINKSMNLLNSSLNYSLTKAEKTKTISRAIMNNNLNIKKPTDSLPPITLFKQDEKKALMDILPPREIEKYEKRYECIDTTKDYLERKLQFESQALTKENKDLENRYAFSTLQLKENEEKNKLLARQINEQRSELKELKMKTAEYMRLTESYGTKVKEKEVENKKLVQLLQDLQNKYMKSDANVKGDQEGDDEEEKENYNDNNRNRKEDESIGYDQY